MIIETKVILYLTTSARFILIIVSSGELNNEK